jgi:ABC-type glycerol-3-phosphate transport system permease component
MSAGIGSLSRTGGGKRPRAAIPKSHALKRTGMAMPLIVLGAILVVIVCLFPFWWMSLSSIKTLRELYTIPPIWWPTAPTWDNYYKVLFQSNIPRYFMNSVIISVGSTGLALILAIFASYGFARFNFKGKPFFQAFVLIGQLLPTAAIIVPLFVTLRVLGLVNTYWGLILVYMIITLPLSVWMLTSYFKAIPVELEEAAIIDGASRLGVLFRITLPLSVPGIVAVIVYSFVTTWNEFIFALCFATDSSVKTLPIGLAEFSTEFNTDWGAVMAASVVMTLPIALLFLSMQRLFVGGLTAGATKG